ncbi:MAG: indole-3-glycerol-phosphate synthase [Crocinitomicaceae bacterium]|nr:indole-3-glycerol-phosphate synthase [Crocinitomicaceae bacterium]
MKTILNTIVDNKRHEVAELKKKYTYADFEDSPYFSEKTRSLKRHILNQNFGIIAEIKRKSPSAGEIRSEINVVEQGQFYEQNQVAGISCLTDHTFFGGSTDDLKELRRNVSIPVLRKEFIIDEIQLFESKAIGADAILLIAEVLQPEEALHFTIMAQSLGLEVLMECHDRANLAKINDLVDIVGVNNRDLHLQKTDIQTSIDLFDFLPKDKVCITESGIRSYSELLELSKVGYKGALVGESILKHANPGVFVQSLQSLNGRYAR